MATYLYNNGKNLQHCVINKIDVNDKTELHKEGFDVNLESELEDDKGVTLTETAGVRIIPQLSGRKSLTRFTLSFKYGVEEMDFWGRSELQPVNSEASSELELAKFETQPELESAKFEAKRKILNDFYLLNEPLEIQFKDLNDFGITQMFMLNRKVTSYELYEEVYIDCVEYSDSHYIKQQSDEAENWYVNTLDSNDLQKALNDELDKLTVNKSTGGA